ncbi:MAG: mannose-1-phosphate guanylyltransferase/mannose-6-phosphate isomerase [Gammaproteobacteria bacterium]|nr:mannose-1-phosphate guanylyltransferase/mannose-6-phosphate isomerase [Gammaproteobacteria bacterium]
MLIPVILAGGVGSRLWPVSRSMLPKQFIDFPNMQGSLFQNTLSRLEGVPDVGDPIVVCNSDHRFLVAEQLRQLGKEHCTILLEPVGRNTAPAVALAALCAQQDDADPLLLVLPADHVIQDQVRFQQAIAQALQSAEQEKLATFGIVPSVPETGYGYIEKGAELVGGNGYCVEQFVEKPDQETAQAYLDSGNYFWNSGMFLFSASTYLQELKRHAPDIFESCHKAYASLERGEDFQLIPESVFASCRSDSIDYAVMEKTSSAVVVPLDAGWNDLGAWDSMWEVQAKDEHGNALSGDVLTFDVRDSYIQSQSRLVAVAGIRDIVVVETADAVLVTQRSQVQSVKHLVQQLQDHEREEGTLHRLVYRPWGSYESLSSRPGYQVKHIVVNAGASLSLQLHHKRAEHWTALKGVALVTCDNKEFELQPNESTYIPVGSKHRLTNPSNEAIEIIEVQIGEYLGEDDIVRFEDRYDRV